MRVLNAVAALAIAVLAAPTLAKEEAAEKTVICKDGSTSKGGKGACSGHGGVDRKATKAAAKPAGAAAPNEKAPEAAAPRAKAAGGAAEAAGATVVCKDGSTSKAGRGACRGHGGVDKGAMKGRGGAAAAAAPPAAAPPPAAPPAAPAAPAPARPAPGAAAAPPAAQVGGARAPAPPNAKNTDPTGAIARCKDGTYSHAKGHTGACSRHGGVEQWLDQPAK